MKPTNNNLLLRITEEDGTNFDGELTIRNLIGRIVHHYYKNGELPHAILLEQEDYTQLMYITEQDFVLGQLPKFRGIDVFLLCQQ